MYHRRKQQFDWTFSLKVGDLVAVALSFPIAFTVWPVVAPDFAIPAADRVTTLNCIFYGALILFFLNRFHLYAWRPFIHYPALVKKLPFALLTSLGAFLAVHCMVSSPGDPAYLPFLFVHLGIDFLLIPPARVLVRLIDTWLGGISMQRGLRGNTPLKDRLVYDLYYIANWSLLLDFRIMLMTLVPPKNAC